jgi:hypothetical protein
MRLPDDQNLQFPLRLFTIHKYAQHYCVKGPHGKDAGKLDETSQLEENLIIIYQ